MTTRFRLLPMRPRPADEPHRAASSLELFFDLVFVVAVSIASVNLHHALREGHVLDGVLSFAVVFFGIWWAWMNFTWFATSFDVDDWLYRVLTFVQMAGVLVLAAGIGPAFEHHDYHVLIFSYVVMRIALVAQWLRAAAGSPELRKTAFSYAGGIVIVQSLWLALLVLPHELQPAALVVLVLAELAVPIVSERRGNTPWHPHHITERYGLFTLIVLGETLLASANAIIEALEAVEDTHSTVTLLPLIGLAVLTLVVCASLWWIYFWPAHHALIGSLRESLRYGYGHYVVFASAAAVSAGVELHINALAGETELSPVAVGFSVSVPVALFMLAIWWIALSREGDRVVAWVVPIAAIVILLDPLFPLPVAVTAVVLVAVVAVLVWRQPTAAAHAE